MSYNIHIGNPPSKPAGEVDLIATAKAINGEKPDLVALQEVDVHTNRSGKSLHQAQELAKLTGMHYFFAKAIDRSGGDYGVALLSRFPILSSSVHSLPVEDGSGAELRAAGIIEIEFAKGQKMVFVATHLDHLTDQNRELQTRELMRVLGPLAQHPIVIGGDFNMNPKNKNWSLYEEEFTMGCGNICPPTFPAGRPITTIDYILLNKVAASMFTVKDYYTVPERYASDHLPLVAVLEYNL
ncbi:endonuclease/exonuclease/phosphatase family protein [Pontibacter sp. 13R65]|uniref:endonuclease/exonuclease/phosphatase family protein n=1 Tax=Pontibacter sp. 13R65 TaxID=3127458 RepID=UPI00301E10C8